MERGRFSLLLLEPGEIYFEDFSVISVTPDTTPHTYDFKKQDGRLKMCSKSLVFDPRDISKPLVKIPLKACRVLEQWKGSAKFLKSNEVLSVICKEYVEMLEGNVIAPYKFKGTAQFLFVLNFTNISNCLPEICQLHRASTLPAAEQADMIATIVHSRQARVHFDPLWLDLYEKVLLEMQADKVTPLAVNPGRLLLSTSRLFFQPFNNIEPYPVLKLNLSSIKSIVKRRFLLRHIGLEIYCYEGASAPHIYLAFRTTKERDSMYCSILEQPELRLEQVEKDVMTLKWQNGVVSNYEYILYINSLGDRTINDLTQYPVFPWVISDYTSKTLDLNDPRVYRDLSKPIGALNEDRLHRLMERYEEMSPPKFIYGSHYSTPGFVLFYLARLYPHYMLCLQGGRFDHPDRMFNSLAHVYKNCLSNMSDFKELTPEFYDIEHEGKFLVNYMGLNFGVRHDGRKIGDVDLPPWAKNPKDFIQKLRDALESDIVSQNLHLWIDLIFGYKQKGEEALKAKNLFYYLCYEGNVDLNKITDLNERHALEVQIMEFGQIPKQVFKVPHPSRKVGPKILVEPAHILPEEPAEVDPWKSITLCFTFSTHKSTVSDLFIMEDNNRIVSVGHDSKLKIFSLTHNRQIRSINIGTMPLSSCLQLPNSNILVIGSWDNVITFYDLDYGRVIENILGHEDTVTCLAWGNVSKLLVSGSSDCTVKIWKGLDISGVVRPLQCLKGQLDHNSHVNCLSFHPRDECLAVGTDEGEIYIWDIQLFSLRKKFPSHSSSVNSVHYGPDGSTLASCGKDKLFQIIEVDTGMSVFNKILASSVECLKWKESLVLVGCENGTLYIWDILTVQLVIQIDVHEGGLKCLDVSSDKNLIVTGGEDQLVKVWKKV